MSDRDPEKNFEALWEKFHTRYPFFEIRGVDWREQYDKYRPKVTSTTGEEELFDIFSEMIRPLNDGHVELIAKLRCEKKIRHFCPEEMPRFHQEFDKAAIDQLFKTTAKTLVSYGFGKPAKTEAWILRYCRSECFGYLRILELEGIKKSKLTAALDTISGDFDALRGMIIDIRDNPGGDDKTVIDIVNRFCDRKRVAFYRKEKTGPGKEDFSPLRSWHIKPKGKIQFTGPIALLTCDSVFSGGEVFALTMKQLPYVTMIGDHTNGIFSYQLEKTLPNGWEYRLSYQTYLSAEMVCFEGLGVPPDIELLNSRNDIVNGVDPLIIRALEVLQSENDVNAERKDRRTAKVGERRDRP